MRKNILLVIISSVALYSTCLGTKTSLQENFKTIREKLSKNKKAHYSKNGFDKTIEMTESVDFSTGLFIGNKLSDQIDTSSHTHHTCTIALKENRSLLTVSFLTKKFVDGIAQAENYVDDKTILFRKPLLHPIMIDQTSTPKEVFAFFAQAQSKNWFW